jgi:hypothetical protein
VSDSNFNEETKKFVYSWLRSQGNARYDQLARDMRFVFDKKYLFDLLLDHKFEAADEYLSSFIIPSPKNKDVFYPLYMCMFVLALEKDNNVYKAARKLYSITESTAFMDLIIENGNDMDIPNLNEHTKMIIQNLEQQLPKYNLHMQCDSFDMDIIYSPFKHEAKKNSPIKPASEELEIEKWKVEFAKFGVKSGSSSKRPVPNGAEDGPDAALSKTKRMRHEGAQSSSKATLPSIREQVPCQPPEQMPPQPPRVQPAQKSQVPPRTQAQRQPETQITKPKILPAPSAKSATGPLIPPQPKVQLQLSPLESWCQYNAISVLANDPNPGKIKQLVPGFLGSSLAGIQEKDKLFFLYWSQMSFENKEVINLSISRISSITHPYVAITTTDSYLMMYGSNQEGTLLKISRTSQPVLRPKPPKEIEIKVILSDPSSPNSLPTHAIFCPFDNNFVLVGFQSGNLGVGRVAVEDFKPSLLYKAEAQNSLDEVCSIDCYSTSNESLLIVFATRLGSVKLLTCSVEKRNNTRNITAMLIEEIFPSAPEVDLSTFLPKVKFHQDGNMLMIKRAGALFIYLISSKQLRTLENLVSDVLLATFTSGGHRLIALGAQHLSCITWDSSTFLNEFNFSLTEIINEYGRISSVAVNPLGKDDQDIVMGTDGGYLISLRLKKVNHINQQ